MRRFVAAASREAEAAKYDDVTMPTVRIANTAAAKPAITGFRRHHRQARCGSADGPGLNRFAFEKRFRSSASSWAV